VLQSTERDEKKEYSRRSTKANSKSEGASDDRYHRSDGDRVGAEYLPGQGDHQSINLEDGEEKFERVVPIAREFGAAVFGRLHR